MLENFFNLEDIKSLDLSFNNLRGRILDELQDLKSLAFFNKSYNNLSSRALNFFDLEDIKSFDLSYYNLRGRILVELQDLKSLTSFNESYNNLSSKALNQGQFGSFDESICIGNPYLSMNNSSRGIAPVRFHVVYETNLC